MLAISEEPASNPHGETHPGVAPSLQELVKSVRTGSEDAAAALLESLYPLVLKIVRSHLPARASEEDLCQMIFVRIFRRIDQYSAHAPFEHWVSRVAVNVCLNQIESERIRPELRYADLSEEEVRIVEELSSTTAEISYEGADAARDLVAKLLLKLEPKDRLIITMLHLEERSIAEISSLTGWSTFVIKVRAFRARQRLKTAYRHLAKDFP